MGIGSLRMIHKRILRNPLNESHLVDRRTSLVRLGLIRKPTLFLNDLCQVFDECIEAQWRMRPNLACDAFWHAVVAASQ